MAEETLNFEQAFARLEHILEQMNSGKASLDDSLKLYVEADELIKKCNRRLIDAEAIIETLVRNRNGELQLNEQGNPVTQPFRGA